MFQRIKHFGKLFWKTGKEFFSEDPFGHAAEIAFYTIFSMPGVLIVVISIAGSIYDRDVVTGGVMDQVAYIIGPESADEVRNILQNAADSSGSQLARIVGIITLLFSATTVFISLQSALNHIWRIRPKPTKGYLKLLMDRVLSFAMVVSIGFMLLVSLILDAILAILGNSVRDLTGIDLVFAGMVNFVISSLIIAVVFALLFKILPDAIIRWKDVWVGAIMTTILFIGGKYLIGFYLGNSQLGSAYGTAGSLVLLLVWIYYSAIIFLFGAQFTHVYASQDGKQIRPAKNAVKIKILEIEDD